MTWRSNLVRGSTAGVAAAATCRQGPYLAKVQPLTVEGYYDPAAPYTVVTVHGLIESPQVWTPVVERLAGNFHDGYVLSLPWHGNDGYLWGQHAAPDEWLELLMDALPPGPKLILAHSFGANALLELMNRRPLPEVHALVLVSPYYKPSYEHFDWALFRHYVCEFDAFLETSVRIRPGAGRLSPPVMAAVVDRLKKKYSSFSWLQFFLLFSKTPGLRLHELDLPVMVMGGDRDLSIAVTDLEDLVSILPAGKLVVLPDCGHFGMFECPAIVSRQIQSFIDDIQERRYERNDGESGQKPVRATTDDEADTASALRG